MPEPTLDLDFIALQQALAGQYSLERELGRGGMGVVYLAREVQLDRPVAIKVLPPALAARAELRERFLREARTAAKLSHPNIVPIHRVDEIGGFVFFAMAFIDGETLAQRVRARGPIPPHEASRLIQEIAWALAYAHARGVVHRDIKPDNILLERGGARALVTDFGIAHVEAASGLTEVGQVMGTAHFMSPEQAAGEALDGRSDLYSLGVVAHFALTGKLPFDGPTVQSILAKHLTQPPPLLAAVSPTTPRALAAAVDRCLAKQPDQRHATGEALAEAIALAQEQRRETPAPLRVWLQKGDGVKWGYAAYALTFGVSAILAPSPVGTPVKLLLPLALHGVYETYQTRQVLAAGYDMDALMRALRTHVEQRREEMAFEYDREPALLWKLVRWLTYGALAVTTAAAAVTFFDLPLPAALPWYAPMVMFGFGAVATVVGGFIGLVNPGRRVARQQSFAELRLKLWSGPVGRVMAKAASFRLRPATGRTTGAMLADRPTEVAIGLAAADLYAALPREAQRELRDLPGTVKRLEEEARAMRRRVDELSGQLAEVGAGADASPPRSEAVERYGDAGELAERRRRAADDLRAARDAAGRRLAAAVAALENIRLDLLRLQAGAGSIESITAVLESVRRIGDEVDAAVASRLDTGAARALLSK
ncbi:MAG TPA: serine/threonine-protein kinase [Gemmatimonadaceae bacterium]